MAAMTLTGANAQTRVGDFEYPDREFSVVPQEFTLQNKSYITFYSEPERGYLSHTYTVLDENFEVMRQFDIPGTPYTDEYDNRTSHSYCELVYHNLDIIGANVQHEGHVTMLTQNLFNNDSKFEYIAPVITGDRVTGAEIRSDDGSVVATITPAADYDFGYAESLPGTLIKMNDNYYLIFREIPVSGDGTSRRMAVFQVGQQNQGISRVDANIPIHVFPSVADRSQTLTVELGEGSNATQVQVVNAAGQVVNSIAVQPGQREVHLNASDLGSGMHIVGARSRDKQGTCKIIVK